MTLISRSEHAIIRAVTKYPSYILLIALLSGSCRASDAAPSKRQLQLYKISRGSESVVGQPAVQRNRLLASRFKARKQSPQVDWYSIEKSVADRVVKHGLDSCLAEVSQKGSTENLIPLLERFSLYSRAGEEEKLTRTITLLKKVKPKPAKYLFSNMADSLIDRKQWSLARKFIETFPQCEPGWGYVFIREWAGEKPAKNKITQIDRWIASIAAKQPESDFWINERLRFRSRTGGLETLIAKLATDLKRHPSDLNIAKRYVKAVKNYGSYLKKSSKTNGKKYGLESKLSWLTATAKPTDAYDSQTLAQALAPVAPETAAFFYRRSLKMKFKESDRTKVEYHMRRYTAMALGPPDFEKALRQWAKSGLARAYQATGESVKAQTLLVELSKDTPSQAPYIALSQFAGQVQAFTPQKPLEKQIKKAEAENKNSPSYWLGRARYYKGRKDRRKAEEAFLKALALTKIPKKGFTNHQIFSRALAVSGYQGYLYQVDSHQAALSFIWQEFDNNDQLAYQKRLLDMVWHHNGKYLTADNNRIWTYLKRVEKWGHTEEHVLWEILKKSKGDRSWKRAEQLTKNAHWSKAARLGWIMTRSNRSRQSIPLLKSTLARINSKGEKTKVSFTLFEAYLNTNDWKSAKTIWSTARKRLTPREISDWAGQIALAAARAGQKQEAMELWKEKDTVDRTDLRNLEPLAKNGLKQELVQYYKSTLARNKQARYAKVALQVLNRSSE